MKKFILLFFSILFFANTNAQLRLEGGAPRVPDVSREFYSDVRAIKMIFGHRSGSGSIGRGFWNISRLDSLGRVIERESRRNRRLLSLENLVYNDNNDVLYRIITNPNRTNDTISRFEYKYLGNRIVYQRQTFDNTDLFVTRLIESEGDSVFVYEQRHYFFRVDGSEHISVRTYILSYRNEQLVRSERIDDNRRRILFFEYHPNGLLKRTKTVTKREEESILAGRWAGGPWGNDVFFEYEFDRYGRIRTLYYIIEGRRHRIATFRYCSGRCLRCRLNPFAWCR